MNIRKMISAAVLLMVAFVAVAQTSPISVKWDVKENIRGKYISEFTVKNVSDNTLGADWAFYYNKFSGAVSTDALQPLSVSAVVNNNYCCLKPNNNYSPLKPGEEISAQVIVDGAFRNISDKPDGGHVVIGGEVLPVEIQIGELTDVKQFAVAERVNYPDGEYMYAENAISNPANGTIEFGAYDILPSVKEVTLHKKGAKTSVPRTLCVNLQGIYLQSAAQYLGERLNRIGYAVDDKAKYKVTLQLAPTISDNKEYYEINVAKKEITITGQSVAGVLNGVKTFVAVLERNADGELPCAKIVDYPDFPYRGMMLDIARNFVSYSELKDFIDRLAEYKINIFQFHFNDDEAWRLEIPGVPELTEVGSRKGFTLNDYEAGFLMQTYTGTGNPNDGKAPANGYITRDEFVELLKYATSRGVKIIPEIETPGHSRAAIVAMRNRYNKYKDTDLEKANQYRNFDLEDKGKFMSVQGFYDNALNVAEPGTYRLIMKVVKELQKMYADAGLMLDVLHMGGDEVAAGCWDNSPNIKKLMEEKGFKNERDVAEHFFITISKWLAKQDIKVIGWQEVAQNHSEAYLDTVIPWLAGVNVWNTLGSSETLAYSLANRGVPVILSNVNNLYLDMVYRPHEYENGLVWGGCVDEILSWETLPYNIYRSAQIETNGKKKNLATAADGKPTLDKPQNIVGLSAELWSETIRNYGMVQEFVFPKIFGLVERSWNSRPEWGEGALDNEKYKAARAEYNLKIGVRELPVLRNVGASFHIAQPGAIVEDGMLKVNAPYPGMTLRYTFDGSVPNETSPIWTAPVPVGDAKLIKVKAYYLGKESVATRLEVK